MRMTRKVGTMLILFLLVAQTSRPDEAEAITTVKKLGGRVTLDPKLPGKPVVAIDFYGTKVSDAELKNLGAFKHLQALYLGDISAREKKVKNKSLITDSGLRELKKIKNL